MATGALTLRRVLGTLHPIETVRSLLVAETDVETIADFAAKVEAARRYDADTLERRNYWGELAIFSSRRLGELIREAPKKTNQHGAGNTVIPALSELGISKLQSSRAQRLAEIEERVIDEYTALQREREDEVSKAGLVRFARAATGEERSAAAPDVRSFGIVTDLSELVASGAKFGCIYADPPWAYTNHATRAAVDRRVNGKRSSSSYKSTMSVDEICAEPVADLAADASHLHLWTTNAFLFEARRVMTEWGFQYKSCFVWVKPQMGIGNYWRVSHEFMLLGVRGGLTFRDRGLKSWVEADRTGHSVKPQIVRQFVMRASPGPYLELYGREQPMDDWTVYGNEVRELLV